MQALLDNEEHDLVISSLSLYELAGVLKQNRAGDDIPTLWDIDRQFAKVIPVDTELAQSAWRLRKETGLRIPMADAIIAATARANDALLVHRDKHLAHIPESLISQLRLRSS